MTAPDMKSLLSEICGPHVDYMWNIQIEG